MVRFIEQRIAWVLHVVLALTSGSHSHAFLDIFFFRGFRQATRGPDTGAFHHPLFRRDNPELCLDMVCRRSRDRNVGNKKTDLKKASSIESSKKKVAPLTPETLAAMSPVTPIKGAPTSPAAVSDDSRSEVSSSNTSLSSSGAHFPGFTQKHSRDVIVADSKVMEASLRQRDEEERLRIAKAMLYDAYQKALRGD